MQAASVLEPRTDAQHVGSRRYFRLAHGGTDVCTGRGSQLSAGQCRMLPCTVVYKLTGRRTAAYRRAMNGVAALGAILVHPIRVATSSSLLPGDLPTVHTVL